VATLAAKAVVVRCCALIMMGVLAWVLPKYAILLCMVLGISPRKPETPNIHKRFGALRIGEDSNRVLRVCA
jgi:hypothetical protein